MKRIYFLSGLPRSGNTLLSSLINQNKKITITANTILCDVMYTLSLLKDYLIFKNFPDHKSLDNILNNIFNNYYKDWESEYIIDRGPWGTPYNLELLKKIIKEPKFIILYRPVLEVLASFIKIENPKNIHKKCEELMSSSGIIGMCLSSTKNIILKKEKYILIYFNDLIYNTENEINKIYNFLNLPIYKHDYKNLSQLKINGIEYNDSLLSANYHKIRTNGINYNKYLISDYLPNDIIKKYSNLDCLL